LTYVIIERLTKPMVKPPELVKEADLMVIYGPGQESVYNWMNLVRMFLENQPASDNNAEVERIARKSNMYHLIDGVIYR
jgi:hypothetical protein